MIVVSMFSIVACASVGPEAALVAVYATLAGYLSQTIFRTDAARDRDLVRKHTLMGVRDVYICVRSYCAI
jgi:H+/Cl- antiporter ClcA